MKTVGIRALKQNASAVIREVASGEEITVTDRGRAVARIVPVRTGRFAELVESGQVRLPVRSIADLGPPLPLEPGERTLGDVLREMRDDERF